jgi:hypothetical protein
VKSFLSGSILSICIVFGLAPSIIAQENRKEESLTNAAIVKLARAGFKEKTIISIISARVPHFDLSPDRMIELKRSGVTEKIIIAMLARQEGMDPLDDSWADDSLSGDAEDLKGIGAAGSKNPNSGSTDIFGSSGNVKGRSRGRGQNGAIDEDTQTVGSATVRILRPPTEAGAAAAKLERTPTLTNEGIQELVEAGFSEGTIIRRIERSPVAFDLTAEKLNELRKHRVTDKVLAAMKAAMEDGSSK